MTTRKKKHEHCYKLLSDRISIICADCGKRRKPIKTSGKQEIKEVAVRIFSTRKERRSDTYA